MKLIRQRFNDLISLVQIFLLREYALKEHLIVHPEMAHAFKRQAKIPPVSPRTSDANNRQPIAQPPLGLSSPAAWVPQQVEQKQHLPATVPPLSSSPPATAANEKIKDQHPDEIVKVVSKSQIALVPLEPPQLHDQTEFWKIFRTEFPDIPTSESVPSDSMAKKLKNAWKNEQTVPPIVVLSFQESEKHLFFLKNIAKAISVRFAPSRVLSALQIEKEKNWEEILSAPALKLIIASDYELYLHPELMCHYREVSTQNRHFLKHVPLLLLSDPSIYLQQPQLKTLLWRAICNELNNVCG